MAITFENGKRIELTSVGASWRRWDDTNGKKVTAEVFKMSGDPGQLSNGNTLCGDPKSAPARYIVFLDKSSFEGTPLLGLAVFGSRNVPHDINSQALCGTFNYSVNR